MVIPSGSLPVNRRWRRVWKYPGRIACLLVGLGFIVLASLSFDDPLMDTTVLRYVPRVLPESENGYLVLAKATSQLGEPQELKDESFSDTLYGRTWDPAQVAGWLKDRDFAIAAVREVRSLELGQKPVPDNAVSAYGRQPNLRLIIDLTVLRARQLLIENDTSAATTMVCDALHAARIIFKSRGDLLTYLFAFSAQNVALETAYEVISHPRTTSADCQQLLDELSRSRPSHEDFTQLIAADFRMKQLVIQGLEHPQNLSKVWKLKRSEIIGYRLPFLFKPNQSLNYVIPRYLYYVSVIDLPLEEKRSGFDAAFSGIPDLCELHGEWLNSYGKRLAHDILAPSLGGVLDSRLRQLTSCSLAEALAALRYYYIATSGQLPASLTELVPHYLPSVPMDYLDGRPLKYSREKKALWSVGENRFDLKSEDHEVEIRDLVIPIRFNGSYAPWKRIDPDKPKDGTGAFLAP